MSDTKGLQYRVVLEFGATTETRWVFGVLERMEMVGAKRKVTRKVKHQNTHM